MTTVSTNVRPCARERRAPHLAVQILGLLAFTGFAIVSTVMAFVMFWAAGVILTLAFVWFGFRPILGQRHRDQSDSDVSPVATASHRSGNTSFDTYRDDVLRRLEDEQVSFDGFLSRLRDAKDAREFDAFMDDRARTMREAPQADGGPDRPARGDD